MTVDNKDILILPVPPAPFALIIGPAMRRAFATDPMQALRHMGLQPERIEPERIESADTAVAPPAFRLRFGPLSLMGGAAATSSLDQVDPDHPSTSLLAASLPRDWRDDGHCWLFVPEAVGARRDDVDQAVGERDVFTAMVLLIDMFDASHIFWSPARLWSDAPQFRASVAEMLTSGMPPVLHLVAFRRQDCNEGEMVATRGLALFTGQELEAMIPAGWTVAEMVKRLARIALDMMLHGRFGDHHNLHGRAPGEIIRLSAAGGGRRAVRVEFDRES